MTAKGRFDYGGHEFEVGIGKFSFKQKLDLAGLPDFQSTSKAKGLQSDHSWLKLRKTHAAVVVRIL